MNTSDVFVINKFPFKDKFIFRLGFINLPPKMTSTILTSGSLKWEIIGVVVSVKATKENNTEFYNNLQLNIYDCLLKSLSTDLYPEIGEGLEIKNISKIE